MLITSGFPERDGPACSTPQLVRRVGPGRRAAARSSSASPSRSRGGGVRRATPASASRRRRSGSSVPPLFTLRDSHGVTPPEGVPWGRLPSRPRARSPSGCPAGPIAPRRSRRRSTRTRYINPKNPFDRRRRGVRELQRHGDAGCARGGSACAPRRRSGRSPVDRATTLFFPGCAIRHRVPDRVHARAPRRRGGADGLRSGGPGAGAHDRPV